METIYPSHLYSGGRFVCVFYPPIEFILFVVLTLRFECELGLRSKKQRHATKSELGPCQKKARATAKARPRAGGAKAAIGHARRAPPLLVPGSKKERRALGRAAA